jgi:hypothetical protein
MSRRIDDLVSINGDVRLLIWGWDESVQMRTGPTRVHHPGLVQQLRSVIVGATSHEEGGNASGKGVKSAPMPGSEGPLSLVIEIDVEAASLAILLGASARSKNVNDNLSFVERQVSEVDDDFVSYVAERLADLVRRSRIELEWSEPARRLQARCPKCDTKNKILVDIDENGISGAHCERCEARWGRADIGSLSSALNNSNISKENGEDE